MRIFNYEIDLPAKRGKGSSTARTNISGNRRNF